MKQIINVQIRIRNRRSRHCYGIDGICGQLDGIFGIFPLNSLCLMNLVKHDNCIFANNLTQRV